MPLVIITHRPYAWLKDLSFRIAEILPSIIAQTLSIPDHPHASLSEIDTEVRVASSGLAVNAPEIAIQILANDYEERRVNLDERTAEICRLLKKSRVWCSSLNGHVYVWVMLCPGSFVKM
ncbi:MAG TPA: hypothetical protein PLQ20_02565 [Candidatus Paceibacterota bacterium]|nr:hypothetical protein [Candidatus Paceibacterota bacterium]